MTRSTRRQRDFRRAKSCTKMLTISAVLFSGALPSVAQAQNQSRAPAQQQRRDSSKEIAGITRQPSDAALEVLLDPNDTVVLLLDHQTGLFQTVKDVPLRELRANT